MDIKMFFEFPGVLITIGVFLLVVSIVIGIIAYKNPVQDEEEVEEIKNKIKEKQEKLSENKDFQPEENFLDTKEEINSSTEDNKIENDLTVEEEVEVSEINNDIEEQKLEEKEVTESVTENLDDVQEEIMSLLNDIDKNNEEPKKEDKEIYGGADPSANIKIENDLIEKEPYEEKTIDLSKTEEIINTLNKENLKPETQEEDIEIL